MDFQFDEVRLSALEQARCCVEEAKALVEQQNELIDRLERQARPTDDARELLRRLITSLQIFRASLARLEADEKLLGDAGADEAWEARPAALPPQSAELLVSVG